MYGKLIAIVLAIFFLAACDPYYSITITNTTDEMTTIMVRKNLHFITEKQKVLSTNDGFDVYELGAKEGMQVGAAIGGLDNDIPFEAIMIINKKDTILASDPESIKRLFDQGPLGRFQTPYNITIR